ncbi:hypothetical protein KM043_003060 [Ampulex compressa]|nr:hypothetical protein KM043_003060 [Ampulex compressa]
MAEPTILFSPGGSREPGLLQDGSQGLRTQAARSTEHGARCTRRAEVHSRSEDDGRDAHEWPAAAPWVRLLSSRIGPFGDAEKVLLGSGVTRWSDSGRRIRKKRSGK